MPTIRQYCQKALKKAIQYTGQLQYPLSKRNMYEFDLQGYTIIRNFIPRNVVDEMNRVLDENQRGEYPRKFPFAHLSPLFFELATEDLVMKVCQYWAGPGFRLDHLQGVQSPPFTKSPLYQLPNDHPDRKLSTNMHIEQHEGFRYYWLDNRSHGGLLTFGFSLHDIKEGDGGLAIIPGSHKQNIDVKPNEAQNYKFEDGSSLVWTQPAMNAGDVIIFTEALIHGTVPWIVENSPRRMLYYRYCAGHMCWRKYNEMEKYLPYAKDNERLSDLLRPPYVAGYNEDEIQVFNPRNTFRTPTRY